MRTYTYIYHNPCHHLYTFPFFCGDHHLNPIQFLIQSNSNIAQRMCYICIHIYKLLSNLGKYRFFIFADTNISFSTQISSSMRVSSGSSTMRGRSNNVAHNGFISFLMLMISFVACFYIAGR